MKKENDASFSVIDSTSSTNYLCTGLILGETYQFKIEARNEYGYSEASKPIILLCSSVPAVPISVLTANDGQNLKITWQQSATNGSPITEYRVYIKESGSTAFTIESTDCDGTNSKVISEKSCNIKLRTLLASPFNLEIGDSIIAKVTASNDYGVSAQSIAGNGAIYTTLPDAPRNIAEDSTKNTNTDLGLTWSEGASNGGLQVLDYKISQRE